MHDIQIKLFGALEIVRSEHPPERPETSRVLSLLGYLITQSGIPQHREKLAELLWPDQPPQRGRRLLSDTLWRTRRLLAEPRTGAAPLLALVGDTITFQVTQGVWLDVAEFERLATSDSVAHLQEAVHLYRSDFLEDCYDDWAIYERERLRDCYVGLLERLLAHYQQQGAHEAALQTALRLLRCDELREETHRNLMRLYYLLGREADALRAYDRCRTLLSAELGAEPAPQTTALYEEIMALRSSRQRAIPDDPDLTGQQQTQLLTETPFVGRRNERASLLQALEIAIAGEGAAVLVVADPGQGKSRLLKELAAGASWRGAQVGWGYGRKEAHDVPLGPLLDALSELLTPLRMRQIAATLDSAYLSELVTLLPHLGEMLAYLPVRVPLDPAHQSQRLYTTILQTLQTLCRIAPHALMLEDIHWFDQTTLEVIETLLPHLYHMRLLIVLSGRSDELPDRAPLWQMLLRLDRRSALRRIDLAGLSLDECAELLRRMLGPSNLPPRLVTRIHESTGGNPYFVIELFYTLQEQHTFVRDQQGVWQVRASADVEQIPLPLSLRQVITRRVQMLASTDRQALATAAVLGQRFTPELWSRIQAPLDQTSASMGELPVQPPPELLSRRFLVEDGDSYQFSHSLLREVVYQNLTESERRELHLRAAEAIEHEHVARVEAMARHLLIAGAWAKAVPYLIQAGDHARDLCAFSDALRAYDQALEAMVQAPALRPEPTIWSLQLKRGQICTLLGNYDAALAAYQDVLQIAAATATQQHEAQRSIVIQALNGICYIYGLRSDYLRAHEASSQALALAQQHAPPADRADTLYQAGLICYRQDEYGLAEDYLQQALTLYESINNPEVQSRLARCLDTLVQCWVQRNGVTDEVLANQERALTIVRSLGDTQSEREFLLSLSNLYVLRGKFVLSLEATEALLGFLRSANLREKIAQCQYLRGAALYRIGQLEASIQALNESLAICRELGRGAAAEFVQLYLGRVLCALGRYDQARAELEQASTSLDRLVRARVHSALTEVWLNCGQLRIAFEHAAEALRLVRQIGARPVLGRAFLMMGSVRAADTRHTLPQSDAELPTAETCFRESIALLEAAHYDADLAEALALYGTWLLDAKHLTEARTMLQKAYLLCATCQMPPILARVQTLLQLLERTEAAQHGVVEVLLARHDAPRGRPLQSENLVRVRWTLDTSEDANILRQHGKTAQRQARLQRLCAEASSLGAEPTIADLAEALGVTVRTVSRDLAALRKAGLVLATRGSANESP